MPGPGPKPRGRPFQSGNPGRPPGSKNKTTRALEQLAEGQAEQVFQKVVEQALAGDVASQRMILDRVYVAPKARPINVTMPPIKGPEDALPPSLAFAKHSGKVRLPPMRRRPYPWSSAVPFK
jgi:Family of unknown function (DUF5681)